MEDYLISRIEHIDRLVTTIAIFCLSQIAVNLVLLYFVRKGWKNKWELLAVALVYLFPATWVLLTAIGSN